jgi:hypothetical protein
MLLTSPSATEQKARALAVVGTLKPCTSEPDERMDTIMISDCT